MGLATAVLIAWTLSILFAASLLIGPRAVAAIASWRQFKRQADIAQAIHQEAREKELELLATDDDLVGCILCRFDPAGHKSRTP